MKKLVQFTFIAAFMLVSVWGSKADEVEKVISKEFGVKKGAVLKISNKHGIINCENWNSDKVLVEVTVKIDHSNKEKAARLLDKIRIDLSGDDQLIEGITDISGYSCNGCDLDIEYKVKMPEWINLDFKMKYGDIFIDNVSGEAKLGVAYGNMKVNSLTNDETELYFSYAKNSHLGSIANAKLNIQYAEVEIETANVIKVKSEYSEIRLGTVYSMEIETQYDEIEITEINSLSCRSNFSEIEIDALAKSLIVESNYGDLEVENVAKDFEVIDIAMNYGDAEIGIDRGASYTLQAELKYGDIEYPEENAKVRDQKTGHTKRKVEGTIGNKSNPSSRVVIYAEHADVEL